VNIHKQHGPHPSEWPLTADRHREVRRVLVWVLVANLMVIVAKLFVGLRSGSIAVFGDAAHSGIDAVNNLVGLFAMRLVAAPPDEQHPYGHGKFETLAALGVAGFLSVTCFELIQGAITRLVQGGSAPSIDPLMITVLAGAMLVNGVVAVGEAKAGQRLSSEILIADARHTASDVFVTAGVLAGLVVTVIFEWTWADAVLALLVALVVAWSGFQILRETIPVLVDERALDPVEIEKVAGSIKGVKATSQIRSRGKLGAGFAELTIHVGREESVISAHDIADSVEQRIAMEMGFSNVTVHVEPELDPSPNTQSIATESE